MYIVYLDYIYKYIYIYVIYILCYIYIYYMLYIYIYYIINLNHIIYIYIIHNIYIIYIYLCAIVDTQTSTSMGVLGVPSTIDGHVRDVSILPGRHWSRLHDSGRLHRATCGPNGMNRTAGNIRRILYHLFSNMQYFTWISASLIGFIPTSGG